MNLKRFAPLWIGLGVLAVAYALAWGLSPGDPTPGNGARATVESRSAETRIGPDVVDRAESYRSETRLLGLAALLVQFVVLAFFAFYRGPPVKRVLEWAARRPLPGSAAIGFGLALFLAIVQLPLRFAGFSAGRDIGLITQPSGDWLFDLALSALITAVLAALGAVVAVWLWRRLGRRFWVAGSAVVALWAVVVVFLWPVVFSPLFANFKSLPEGPTRTEIERLADRAGIKVGRINEVDSSRRSSAINAYVNGIGPSKQVVIYDSAIRELTRAELSALIAHELGHVKANDLYRGLAFGLLVIPLGVFFVQAGTTAAVRRSGDDPRGPGIVPALALMTALAALFLSFPGNLLSRAIESRADTEALVLTGNPDGFISLQVRLAWANISDPDPPGFYRFLFGSHPTTGQRIEKAEAWPVTGSQAQKGPVRDFQLPDYDAGS